MSEPDRLYVECSREFLERLKTWTVPVQVRAEQFGAGEWTLIFRECWAQDARRVFLDIMRGDRG